MISSRIPALCLVILAPALLWGQPKFRMVGGTKFNFGQVYTGKTVKHNLLIENPGTDTLVITDVSASCGCTGTLMSNSHIAPGDTGILSISFDSRRFSGDIEKTVSMNTNDTTQSHVRVTFVANVVKTLELIPEYVVFRTPLDSASTQEVSFKNIGITPVRILSISSSQPDLVTVKASATEIKPGDDATLTCMLKPKSPGTLNGTITITTDHPKMPMIDVRFFGLVSKSAHSSAPGSQN